MRVRQLRGEGDDGTVRLVYPSTIDEYWKAIEALESPAAPRRTVVRKHGDRNGGRHGPCYVVTTAAQRDRWGLPDLGASRRARVVDEGQAFDLLRDKAAVPEVADGPLPDTIAEAPPQYYGGTGGSALEAVRALVTPGARIDQVLGALEVAGLPHPVRKKLQRALRQTLESEAHAVEDVLDRAEMVLSLPWRAREPERFDRAQLQQALDRSHTGLEKVKARILDALSACPQTRGPLTVERAGRSLEAATNTPPALLVRPGPAPVLCLTGARGTGKTSLAVAVAAALGRTHVHVPLDKGNAKALIHGVRNGVAGRITAGLRSAGVGNPVFILAAIDRVDAEAADVLLDMLDPARRKAFRDEYLDVRFDLSAVLWIVTATDAGAILEAVRKRLEIVELPAYGEQEKLAIAERHLLRRPFDPPSQTAAGWLAPEPEASSRAALDAASDGPAIVVDREVSSVRELEAWSVEPPPSDTAEAWRRAACTGEVRFEPEAIRRVIRNHTSEAGVSELNAKLAAICRQVVRRQPPGGPEPEVITPAVVREVLGDGAADPLPPAVQAAIARERRRLGDSSDDDTVPTNDWIECLEQLPWDRRSDAPVDLAQARAVLDAGHAGLDDAKARIVEHLAVCRRNPCGAGAVICLVGPPGVGKTSLARCVAEALGRGFVKLSCGGLRDETDLRGHNRTWKDAQPGWILRELRRVGSRDPVFVLDEIDKLGARPAGVLLEVLDPSQHDRFHDAFVELPFDLSGVLFITTANEPDRIPPALRDRLEMIELSGYTEAEKIAIAETHLVEAQNRAAGLAATPIRFTRGACRRIIRDYTSERGIRQLARCLQTICRKVTLGLETGDAALVRERITARNVRALSRPTGRRAHGGARAPARAARPHRAARCRTGSGPAGPGAAVRLGTDRSRACAGARVSAMPAEPALDGARAAAPVDLARARAVLDRGHAAHGAVKGRLLDYAAVRLAKPDAPSPLLILVGPSGVGKTSLARLLAAALGRACAWVYCGSLTGAAVLHGARSGRPGRIVDELRRVGVRNPVFVLDEIDRLEDAGAAAALLDALDPAPGTSFRDHCLDVPVDLTEALFVATATSVSSVPPMLRERMRVIEVPGYTCADKRVIAAAYLWPLQLALHGLTTDQVRIGDDAVEAVVRGYTHEPGVWDLTGALGALCARVVRRRGRRSGARRRRRERRRTKA